jgi:DNA processing protein
MNEQTLAALLEITALPRVGPARARWLLSEMDPIAAAEALRRRTVPVVSTQPPAGVNKPLLTSWFGAIRDLDGEVLLEAHRAAGVQLFTADHPLWPFADDPEPPVLLFALGRLDALAGPNRVAVVGTRRCTSLGRRVATDLGAGLTAAGVSVVSGLALGIDGAAHSGALEAVDAHRLVPLPVAIVGAGLDRVYPPRNGSLWAALVKRGLVLSEAPLGAAPERWRFPARNRLLAGMSDAVVVVESHQTGGALLTVDEAADRGIPVFAVPGSVLSAAAEGSNGLLIDGCAPVRNATDVVELLGICPPPRIRQEQLDLEPGPDPLPGAVDVMDEVAAGAVHLDTLVARTGQNLAAVLVLLRQLELAGKVRLDGSWVHIARSGQSHHPAGTGSYRGRQ